MTPKRKNPRPGRLFAALLLFGMIGLLWPSFGSGKGTGRVSLPPPLHQRQVAFVDAAVRNSAGLLAGLDPAAMIVRIDPKRDGVEQMQEWLRGQRQVGVIHLIAHGRPGALRLGSALLDATSMRGHHEDALAAVGRALVETGDLLVYGCRFGEGQRGREAVRELARTTGVDVAASDDPTGNIELGGDWELEIHDGEISAGVAVDAKTRAEWSGILQGICDRTPQVRGALVAAISGVSACGEVTAEHLAGVAELSLAGAEIMTLQKGDFSGLTSLKSLNLHGNSLGLQDPLPEELFRGLGSLRVLILSRNNLGTLPEGIFGGLSALLSLNLSGSALTELPRNIFNGLDSLEELHLQGNRMSELPIGIFDDVLDTLRNDFSRRSALLRVDSHLRATLAFTSTEQTVTEGTTVRVGVSLSRAVPVAVSVSYTLGGTAEREEFQDLEPAPETGLLFLAGETVKEIVFSFKDLDSQPDTAVLALNRYPLLLRSDGTGPFPSNLHPTALVNRPEDTATHTVNISDTDDAQGVCDRTQQVRDALVSAIAGASVCSEVTEAHLAGVATLTLSESDIGQLEADDFRGLSSLRQLLLDNNPLSSLPEGLFNGLSSLQQLDLSATFLSSLPANIFQGLSSLQHLRLRRTSLSSLPVGIFRGLNSLRELYLDSTSLSSLHQDLFRGLRTLQALYLGHNSSLVSLPGSVFGGLASLQTLQLENCSLEALPASVFHGLVSLQVLQLNYNSLSSLPVSVFDGLSSLKELELVGNPLDELPKGIFDDVLDTLNRLDVHFDLEATIVFASVEQTVAEGTSVMVPVTLSRALPVSVRVPFSLGGSASPEDYEDLSPSPGFGLLFLAGETRKEIAFTIVEDEDGPDETVVLRLGEYSEIRLRRSDGTGADSPLSSGELVDLDFKLIEHIVTISGSGEGQGVCGRTPQVRDALVGAIREASSCEDVTAAQLTRLNSLALSRRQISTLQADDFRGLSALKELSLQENLLGTLPTGIFRGLRALTRLDLSFNAIQTLDVGVFDGLPSLETLWLNGNALETLPRNIFEGLDSLRTLSLNHSRLKTLPEGAFNGLESLYVLHLDANALKSLPSRIFSGMSSLQVLHLERNSLNTLPETLFGGLSNLFRLWLDLNDLKSLPEEIFRGLGSLEELYISHNQLTTLPAGVFGGLGSLREINLQDNPLISLPRRIFDGLDSLVDLNLFTHSLNELPAGIFDDVLDTLAKVELTSLLQPVLAFASGRQNAARGITVKVPVTLSRATPVAVRVPYSVGGSATPNDFGNLSPAPDTGLLFLAGETSKEITLTILENNGSQDETVVLTLAVYAEIGLRRSDGTGQDAAQLRPHDLLKLTTEGIAHTVTISDSANDPDDFSDFTSTDLVGERLTLNGTLPDESSDDVTLIFQEGNRFEETGPVRQSTTPVRTDGQTAEAVGTTSRFGDFEYQRTGSQTGTLTLEYDDGESCTIELMFTSAGSGSSSHACSGGRSGSGKFQLSLGFRFVPVILRSGGLNGAFFISEMTLTNRGFVKAELNYTYTAKDGGGSGKASEVLPPGHQQIVPDAIEHLRKLGVPIPETGNFIGTLRVEVSGSSKVGVVVRTTTVVPEGRTGLTYPGIPGGEGFQQAVYLCGLRQNRQDRSNVAFQNMGALAEGPITVRTTVFSGEANDSDARILSDVTLKPGGFHQYSGVLGRIANGYVKVEKVNGAAPFYAYGVINDQANSDGSFVFPVSERSLQGSRGQTLPVVLERGPFASELTVTNFSSEPKRLRLSLVADGVQAPDGTATLPLTIEAGEQQIIPNVIAYARQLEIPGIGPASLGLAGALFATAVGGDLDGVVIGARTGTSGGGGQYSVFYNAVPRGAAFTERAWVYALQQNEENRSNLALVNTGEVDDSDSVFQLDIYDGETGYLVNYVSGITLKARNWLQFNSILAQYGQSIEQGYVGIKQLSGNNPFWAYGVINDGASPGQRSGDGAYLPARE